MDWDTRLLKKLQCASLGLLLFAGANLVSLVMAAEFKVDQVLSLDANNFDYETFGLETDLEQIPVEVRIPGLPGDKQFVIRSELQTEYCDKVDQRLRSVSLRDCYLPNLIQTGYSSKQGQALLQANYSSEEGIEPLGRILLLGGVHGDELSSVSIVFKWLGLLEKYHAGEFVWRVVPIMNPDGLFHQPSLRTNANGIDLNRNMPTPDWHETALKYWRTRANQSPRKYPGDFPGSEPETQWLMHAVQGFKPDVIISVHAPHNLVDYDAPKRDNGPVQLGSLKKKALGTYPGSLGNYAGEKRGIPVVTIELPHSRIAVDEEEYKQIWLDLLVWLGDQLRVEKQRFGALHQTGTN